MPDDGWDGILDTGETVLWQGQPDPAPDWSEFRAALAARAASPSYARTSTDGFRVVRTLEEGLDGALAAQIQAR